MQKIIEAAHYRLMEERYQEYIHHKRAAEMWRDEDKRRFGAEEDEDDQQDQAVVGSPRGAQVHHDTVPGGADGEQHGIPGSALLGDQQGEGIAWTD